MAQRQACLKGSGMGFSSCVCGISEFPERFHKIFNGPIDAELPKAFSTSSPPEADRIVGEHSASWMSMPTQTLSPVNINTCIGLIKLMCYVSLFFVMAEMCSGVGSIYFLVFHGVTPWVGMSVLLII